MVHLAIPSSSADVDRWAGIGMGPMSTLSSRILVTLLASFHVRGTGSSGGIAGELVSFGGNNPLSDFPY